MLSASHISTKIAANKFAALTKGLGLFLLLAALLVIFATNEVSGGAKKVHANPILLQNNSGQYMALSIPAQYINPTKSHRTDIQEAQVENTPVYSVPLSIEYPSKRPFSSEDDVKENWQKNISLALTVAKQDELQKLFYHFTNKEKGFYKTELGSEYGMQKFRSQDAYRDFPDSLLYYYKDEVPQNSVIIGCPMPKSISLFGCKYYIIEQDISVEAQFSTDYSSAEEWQTHVAWLREVVRNFSPQSTTYDPPIVKLPHNVPITLEKADGKGQAINLVIPKHFLYPATAQIEGKIEFPLTRKSVALSLYSDPSFLKKTKIEQEDAEHIRMSFSFFDQGTLIEKTRYRQFYPDGSSEVFDNVFAKNTEKQSDSYGLQHYQKIYDKAGPKESVYYQDGKGVVTDYTIITCKMNQCALEASDDAGIIFQVHFPNQYLKAWQPIKDHAVTLIQTFKTSPPEEQS